MNSPRRIYVASSWRNERQPAVVAALRAAGHEVYDFRHPEVGNDGFSWRQTGADVTTIPGYLEALKHPIAKRAFGLDHRGMEWANTFVLLLPCGRSAHLEMGWACGKGKDTVILLDTNGFEPELMYLEAKAIVVDVPELLRVLAPIPPAADDDPFVPDAFTYGGPNDPPFYANDDETR